MRTSGSAGAEGWIAIIPIVALIVVASMSAGGLDAMLMALEATVRHTISAIIDFVRGLF